MYVVIFKARTKELDEEYFSMEKRMRELAMGKYGCKEFTAVTEGSQEITISYWGSLEQIKEWKKDSEHLVVQELGKSKWYEDYTVEIIKVLSSYTMDLPT